MCPSCGYNNLCDSSGKAGTKDEERKIVYVWGPCNEGQRYCANCNYDWMPFYDNMLVSPHLPRIRGLQSNEFIIDYEI